MKITVHPDRCTASGRCYQLVPEVFTSDDDGYVQLQPEQADVSEETVREAAEACPTASIEVFHVVDPRRSREGEK